MRRFLLAGALLAAAAAPALAADLARPAPVYVPPPVVVPIALWTGFYVGGDIGWFGAHQSATTTAFPSPGFGAPAVLGAGIAGFGNLPTSHTLNGTGVLGGIHAGYNYQVTSFVFGGEGDVMFLNRNPNDAETVFETFTAVPAPAFNMLLNAQNKYLASVRGRIGWTTGSLLLYATGGAAWTNTSYTATATGLVAGSVNLPGIVAAVSFSNTKTGYVLGGGAEWMLTPHWLVRAEYLHYGFDGSSGVLPLVVTSGVAGATCTPGACNWAATSSKLDFDTVRVGVSYKFGG
jgi:outer membrane immunogenic protein